MLEVTSHYLELGILDVDARFLTIIMSQVILTISKGYLD
jgi:hypothetical protein